MNSVFNLFNGQVIAEVPTSTTLDFVRALQPGKIAQGQWSETSLQDRSKILRQIESEIKAQAQALAQDLARSQGLSLEFVQQNEIEPAIRAFSAAASTEPLSGQIPKATGLIGFLGPEFQSFRFLAERISAALMAGNGIFIGSKIENAIACQWIKKICQPLPANLLNIFHSTENEDTNLFEVITAHPSIAGVCAMGFPKQAEKILKDTSGAWKKLQIISGYHNSALISSEANLKEAAQALVESCFTGMGQLHSSVSNILVTEAMLESFQGEFVSALANQQFAKSEEDNSGFGPMRISDQDRIETLWKTIRSENGKVIFGGDIRSSKTLQVQPLVVQDMSHCSVLQQDCLAAPVVLISPVKYVHEMFKWSNTSYYGMLAQVLGPEEKIQKFASKLEVSRIVGANGLSPLEALPLGIKQSFSGNPDLHPFGSFFSDLRKIDS